MSRYDEFFQGTAGTIGGGEAADFIYPMLVEHFSDLPQRWQDDGLYVSDLGRHPAKAMRRAKLGEVSDFKAVVRMVMNNGVAFERDTFAMLSGAGGLPKMMQQFPLHSGLWRGYADLVIGHGGDAVTIVEHKGTNDRWFDYKQSLPRAADICQIWLYGEMYRHTYGVQPKLVLFYRSWKQCAECHLTEDSEELAIRSRVWIDGDRQDDRVVRVWPHYLQTEMERFYKSDSLALALPEGVDSWDYALDATARIRSVGFGDE